MFLTRLGFGSKVVVTGDITQIDLPREQASGPDPGAGHPRVDRRDRVRRSSGTRTSCGTSSCSASSRRTSATPKRPERSGAGDRGRGREPVRRRRRRGGRRRSSCAACSRGEGVDSGEVGLAFVGPEESRALKREHLGVDEATDALAFPIDGLDELPEELPRAARRRRRLPAGRRRRVARAARARRPPPRRLRPRRRRWRRGRRCTREHLDAAAPRTCSATARPSVPPPRAGTCADAPRQLQLRVRGDHPRPPDAAEPAHPLPHRDRRASRPPPRSASPRSS